MEIPAIFYFTSIPLKSSSSGSNGDKGHFLAERAKIRRKMLEVKTDIASTESDLVEVNRNMILARTTPEAYNNALKGLKNKYETFFDEDSGNTTKEGLEQIKEELKEDLRSQKREYQGLVIKYEKVVKKITEFESSNSLLFFVIRPFHSLANIPCLMSNIKTLFTLLLTIFSLGLTFICVFTNLHIDTPYFIHGMVDFILSFIKYEILISLPLFI
jgi:hypothetical protein